MKLVIVESPSKAKTIEKYLGKEYKVVASVGHIRDLPKSDKNAIDIENGFKPNYVISQDKENIISAIKKEAKKSDEVILATDPDREGEAIAWHLKEAINIPKAKRITFQEITKEAIEESLNNKRDIDQNLKKAQEARRVLDRLFGYTLSALIWKKVRYGLSAGRVQTPTLRILLKREMEIKSFIPEKFYELFANFKYKGKIYVAECKETIKDKKEVENIIKIGKKGKWIIDSVKLREVKRSPKPPFTTSTLQQAGNSVFGWSPSNTMRIAQKLYENGHISYMRTDSVNLSETAHKQIKEEVEKTFGKENYNKTFYKTKSKSAQEAHEAVRPTKINIKYIGKTEEQKKLYDLIRKRTLSSQMKDAKIERKTITFKTDKIPEFVIRGSKIIYEGWLMADPNAKNEDVLVEDFIEKSEVDCTEINSEEKETSPPQRYSEAGLVKVMESVGIGRPSTFASTIRTLLERGYVEKQSSALYVTDLGEVVGKFLQENFTKYVSYDFTEKIENTLDEIANGHAKYTNTLSDFYFPFKKDVDSKKDIEKLTTLGDAPEEFKCPKCSSTMVYKLAKNGTFISCSNFPDCMGARTKEGEEIKEPESIGKECPRCGKGDLVKRAGRFGYFVSCSLYPKCKYIEEDEEEKKKKSTGVKCLECNKGQIIERMGKFGKFYSCERYPDCKFAIKAKPTGEKCLECGSLMMEGTKTIPTRCSSKSCPMHNPHKLK